MLFHLSHVRRLSQVATVLFTCVLATLSAHAQPRTLTRSTTAFTGAGTYQPTVAFGNGTFVALGLKNTPPAASTTTISAHTSPDGDTWTERVVTIGGGGFANHGAVRFINGRFVFTGTTVGTQLPSYTATSTDGITWTVANTPNTAQFADLVTGGGTSVGFFGTTLSSSADGGATWTSRAAPGVGAFSPYQALAYGNGRFVLISGSRAWTSPDGAAWADIAGTQSSGRVAFGNGLFALTGTTYRTSTDGVTFTARTPTGMTLAGTNTLRFAVGRFLYHQFTFSGTTAVNQIVASGDGITWTPFASYPAGAVFNMNDVAEGNNRLVVVGFTQTQVPVAAFLDATNLPAAPIAPVAPAITTPPVATAAVIGRSAALSVAASGGSNQYQWKKDGTTIIGATTATYIIASVSAASAGSYTVTVTNEAGSITSTPVALTIVPAAQAGRLINLSVRTSLDSATDEFTLGYVVGGPGSSGQKPLVLRAAGPSLAAFGVTNSNPDPKMETFAGSTKTGDNDNWGGSAQLTTDLAAVGAFAFSGPSSKDAAISTSIASRDNSVKVTAVGGATGEVLAEVYDATPSPSFAATTPRLLNVSVNKSLGTGLTAGFVLGGSTPTRVLIRVVGPGLAAFGVGGTVADPQLVLFSGNTKIGENNDWGGSAELTAAFTAVGAFGLAAVSSKDAALLVSLPPGQYSVQASGVGGTSGVALVEVYEVP